MPDNVIDWAATGRKKALLLVSVYFRVGWVTILFGRPMTVLTGRARTDGTPTQMNPTEIGIRLVAGVLLILANGFFVAIEFALTRARQFTESEFVDGDSRLERAWEMTQELELYLTTCQVGITRRASH